MNNKTLFTRHVYFHLLIRSASAKSSSNSSSKPSTKTVQKQIPSQYCLQLVRKHDFENYLCTLLIPKDIRSVAFAIRAFNVEIALIQDHAKEKLISDMRYAFWNDTLTKIYSHNPPEAPVPLDLFRILSTCKLSKRYFQRLIDARWKKSKTDSFSNLSSIEDYSENTVSSIYYLLLEAKNIKDINVDHLASHIGKAQGITTLIRSVPYHARHRHMVLPEDICLKHGVSSESIFRCKTDKNLGEVIFKIATRANQHLEKAKSIRKNIEGNLSFIFLPAVNVERFLAQLQGVDFDIFHPNLTKTQNMLPANLLISKWFSGW